MSGDVKPKAGKPAPALVSDDRTDPGGPSHEVLARARAAQAEEAAAEEAPVAPGPGDATLIYDKNKKGPGGEAPRLLVVAGPRTGSEFTLTEAETSIGRGSDNVLVIPDISVSRRHVVIQREGDQYVVIDQRSGNGTRVNGRAADRHVLQSGDEVAMGDTVVRFVEPGGVVVKAKGKGASAPPPAARAQPSLGEEKPEITQAKASGLQRRLRVYIALAAALVVVLVLGAMRKAQREREAAAAAAEKDEGRDVARKRFEEGVRLLKEARWAEARDKLKVAAELDPQDPDVQRYLERAEAEAPRAQAVLQARLALQKRDYVTAKGALAGVPDDSALAEAAREQGAQLKAAMESAVREARIRAENGDAAGAAALLEPVLQADPGRPDALAVREALGGARRGPGGAAPPRREKAPAAEASAAAPAQLGPIIDSFLAGDLGGALERAEAAPDSRSKKLADDLRAFDAAYRDGLAKTQARNLVGALKAFEQADRVDRALAQGRESRLGKEVRRALGNLHYNLGVASQGDDATLPQAAQHLRAAVAADPSNEGARRALSDVTASVKEVFQRGYFEKDSDPEAARKAFKLVLESLPASDDTAQKARRWLDKLEGKAAPEE